MLANLTSVCYVILLERSLTRTASQHRLCHLRTVRRHREQLGEERFVDTKRKTPRQLDSRGHLHVKYFTILSHLKFYYKFTVCIFSYEQKQRYIHMYIYIQR